MDRSTSVDDELEWTVVGKKSHPNGLPPLGKGGKGPGGVSRNASSNDIHRKAGVDLNAPTPPRRGSLNQSDADFASFRKGAAPRSQAADWRRPGTTQTQQTNTNEQTTEAAAMVTATTTTVEADSKKKPLPPVKAKKTTKVPTPKLSRPASRGKSPSRSTSPLPPHTVTHQVGHSRFSLSPSDFPNLIFRRVMWSAERAASRLGCPPADSPAQDNSPPSEVELEMIESVTIVETVETSVIDAEVATITNVDVIEVVEVIESTTTNMIETEVETPMSDTNSIESNSIEFESSTEFVHVEKPIEQQVEVDTPEIPGLDAAVIVEAVTTAPKKKKPKKKTATAPAAAAVAEQTVETSITSIELTETETIVDSPTIDSAVSDVATAEGDADADEEPPSQPSAAFPRPSFALQFLVVLMSFLFLLAAFVPSIRPHALYLAAFFACAAAATQQPTVQAKIPLAYRKWTIIKREETSMEVTPTTPNHVKSPKKKKKSNRR